MPLVRLSGVLTIAFLALVVAASIAGAMTPRQRVVGVLDVNCPMPCWQGIRPGITDVDTAISLLSISPFVDTRFMSVYRWTDVGAWRVEWSDPTFSAAYRRGSLTVDGDIVQRVELTPSPAWRLTAGEIAAQLGMPAQVVAQNASLTAVGGRGSAVVFYYPEAGLEVMAVAASPFATGYPYEGSSWANMRVTWLSFAALEAGAALEWRWEPPTAGG